MITIDASNAESGIDFETFIRGGFLSDVVGGGFPVFDNGGNFGGAEMFFWGFGLEPTDKYVLARGDINYYFSTHTVWGEIDTIEYGVRGGGDYNDDGAFVGGDVQLRITGLSLTNAQPTSGDEEAEIEANGEVHNFTAATMGGASGDPDRLDAYAEALDSEAQHFIGSDHDDIFTGTAFDDIIEGNGGNDLLAGNGGNDLIDGGADIDTAVFAGNFADYEVTRFADGRTIVRPSAVSVGTDETTLKNVESIAFDDQTLAVDDLPVLIPRGRIVVDASNTDGVDFTTYIAAYFAKAELDGTYEFHGGTPDNAYGQVFYLNGDQLSFQYAANGDAGGESVYVAVLDGEEIAYDFIHHGPQYGHDISGKVDSLSFGVITGAAPESGPEAFTDYAAEIVISGLGLDDAPDDPAGAVHALYNSLIGGDSAAIEALLAQYAQDFKGSDGADKFVGGQFNDNLRGRGGDDTLSGGGSDDVIKGGRGEDVLDGGAGADLLIAGKDKDRISGGSEADVFQFNGAGSSGAKAADRDKILDFSQDDGDLIDLSGFGGLDFIGAGKFSGDGDELRVIERKNGFVVKVDSGGHKGPDFSLKVMGTAALAEDDFLL